ncbi:MAG: hypothetical protein ACYDB7_00600 [Mycobacteriales bacterium]
MFLEDTTVPAGTGVGEGLRVGLALVELAGGLVAVGVVAVVAAGLREVVLLDAAAGAETVPRIRGPLEAGLADALPRAPAVMEGAAEDAPVGLAVGEATAAGWFEPPPQATASRAVTTNGRPSRHARDSLA